MRILCIFLLGNEWYPTKEANSLFSLVAFHFVSRNIVLCHTNDTSLKKEAVDNELFWVLLFFCLFYNHHQKKKWQWKWKKNCWSLPSSTFLLCLYTKNCFAQTNFCSSVYHQIFPVVKIFSFCQCCKKWETKGWCCVKATFDISFQRSAKKETSALSHQHKSRNQ